MTDGVGQGWMYASLALDQPGWPGTKKATWVATTADGSTFRSPDALEAMNRLGEDGWELVTFFPAAGDRPGSFYFRAPRRDVL
jgi:hypothetical protein